MMKKLSLLLVLFAFACGDDDGRTTTDSAVMFDTGVVLTDAGDDSATVTDTGMGTDAGMGRQCTLVPPPMAVPAAMLPRCSAATLTCLMGAGTDGAAQQACVDADTTPAVGMAPNEIDCGGCLSAQGGSCAIAMGCDDEWNSFACCAEDSGCGDVACVQTMCAAEITGFQTCQQGVGAACGPVQQMCFAPAGG